MQIRHDIGLDVRLRRTAVDKLVIHRTAQKSLEDLAKLFLNPDVGTGGKFPYHIVIFPDGSTRLCVPLNRAAPGAMIYNDSGVQIALTGDFRFSKSPTTAALVSLESVCLLMWKLFGRLPILGHTQMPGTTDDAKKVCPGKNLDLKHLYAAVSAQFAKRDTLSYA